jgi:hypothetical protein
LIDGRIIICIPGTIRRALKYHTGESITGEKGDPMRTALSIWILTLLIVKANVLAWEAETLAEAKSLAASRGLPILMEFFRPG